MYFIMNISLIGEEIFFDDSNDVCKGNAQIVLKMLLQHVT